MDTQNTILDSNTLQIGNEKDYELATFGERFVAAFIDGLIIFIPSYFIPIIAPWLYYSLQYSSQKQATVGQRTMNIKVISLDSNKISFGQGTGRFFAKILSALPLLAGYFMFFFNDKKQCLHDYLANTIVVKDDGR